MRISSMLAPAVALMLGGVAVAADADATKARLSDATLRIIGVGDRGVPIYTILIYFSADGDYTSVDSQGGAQKGVWRATASQVCSTAVDPLPPPEHRKENCLEIGAHGPGDQWEVRTPGKATLVYRIEKDGMDEPWGKPQTR